MLICAPIIYVQILLCRFYCLAFRDNLKHTHTCGFFACFLSVLILGWRENFTPESRRADPVPVQDVGITPDSQIGLAQGEPVSAAFHGTHLRKSARFSETMCTSWACKVKTTLYMPRPQPWAPNSVEQIEGSKARMRMAKLESKTRGSGARMRQKGGRRERAPGWLL